MNKDALEALAAKRVLELLDDTGATSLQELIYNEFWDDLRLLCDQALQKPCAVDVEDLKAVIAEIRTKYGFNFNERGCRLLAQGIVDHPASRGYLRTEEERHAEQQTARYLEELHEIVADVDDDRPIEEGTFSFRNTLKGKILKLKEVYIRQPIDWQPVGTHPKDGREFLVGRYRKRYGGRFKVYVTRWKNGNFTGEPARTVCDLWCPIKPPTDIKAKMEG